LCGANLKRLNFLIKLNLVHLFLDFEEVVPIRKLVVPIKGGFALQASKTIQKQVPFGMNQ
jgi:hypothetical protein